MSMKTLTALIISMNEGSVTARKATPVGARVSDAHIIMQRVGAMHNTSIGVGVTNRRVLQKARSVAFVVPFGQLQRT